MRLINTSTFDLKEFFGNIPPYAILSHTWGTEEGSEVTFAQWVNRSNIPIQSPGLAKILKSCELAAAEGLEYVWVDTCCIDKSSSAELSEAINSMFMWYQRAQICYAYLEDLELYPEPYELQVTALKNCRWFTRGWTLQELIAPKNVRFYYSAWTSIGTKSQLARQLAEITNISYHVLINNTALASFSVAQRMSWAARRTTTRKEDAAYCLLGLFGVNMPLLYGEEDRAFARLQEHIMQKTNDLSILAWSHGDEGANIEAGAVRGCLATSPAEFAASGGISREDQLGMMEPELVVTNKGIRIDTIRDIEYTKRAQGGRPRQPVYILRLNCFIGAPPDSAFEVAIQLQKWGPNVFVRDMSRSTSHVPNTYEYNPRFEETQTIYLLTSLPSYVEGTQGRALLASYHRAAYCISALRIEPTTRVNVGLSCTKRWPASLWDAEQSVFFVPVGGEHRQWTACKYVARFPETDEATTDVYQPEAAWLSFYVVLIWTTDYPLGRRPSQRRSKKRETTSAPEGRASCSYLILEVPSHPAPDPNELDGISKTLDVNDSDTISRVLDAMGKNQRDWFRLRTSLQKVSDNGWLMPLTLKEGGYNQYQSIDCTMRIEDDFNLCTGPMWEVDINFRTASTQESDREDVETV